VPDARLVTEPAIIRSNTLPVIDWRWKTFPEFSLTELYEVLAIRSHVFVVEQHCIYADMDGLDVGAWHLCGYATREGGNELAAYLRVLLPKSPNNRSDDQADEHDIRIGRVLTSAAYRNTGLGKRLLERALQLIGAQWPGEPLRLHAQAHLQAFYGGFGFVPCSVVHHEDGIAHIWMRRD
jgi:ElaA protein